MVEVQVSGLQHTHDLYPFYRFTVKGDGGGLDKLHDKPLQGDHIYGQLAAHHKPVDTVEQRVHPEEALGVERPLHLSLSIAGGDMSDQ